MSFRGEATGGVNMMKTMKMLCVAMVVSLGAGCTSVRFSDVIDGVGKVKVRDRTDHKYHIEKLLRKGMVCDGALMEGVGDSCDAATEIDGIEQMVPEVFDRHGIPCSVVVEVEFEDDRSLLSCVWRLLCGCTLCALPSKRTETCVYTYLISSEQFPHEGRFVLMRRREEWMSSVGLNYLMPFSQDESKAYCRGDGTFTEKGSRAELDGLAFALKALERSAGGNRRVRPIGRRIGK